MRGLVDVGALGQPEALYTERARGELCRGPQECRMSASAFPPEHRPLPSRRSTIVEPALPLAMTRERGHARSPSQGKPVDLGSRQGGGLGRRAEAGRTKRLSSCSPMIVNAPSGQTTAIHRCFAFSFARCRLALRCSVVSRLFFFFRLLAPASTVPLAVPIVDAWCCGGVEREDAAVSGASGCDDGLHDGEVEVDATGEGAAGGGRQRGGGRPGGGGGGASRG